MSSKNKQKKLRKTIQDMMTSINRSLTKKEWFGLKKTLENKKFNESNKIINRLDQAKERVSKFNVNELKYYN